MASGAQPQETTPLLQGDAAAPRGSARSQQSAASSTTKRRSLREYARDKIAQMKQAVSTTYNCYSLEESHCSLDTSPEGETRLSGYDVQKLTTMRVFAVATGTVLECPLLWIEMGVIGFIYIVTFSVLMHYRWEGFSQFVGSDTDVRAFISMFSMLIGLLLSFYTSMNIGRWWSMRTAGVEGISQGCSKLTILLSQGVTRDPSVLSAVKRYAIGSLVLFFMRDLSKEEQMDKLVQREVLLPMEAEQLVKIGDKKCYPEVLWVWLANLVTQCWSAGLIKGPPHYCALLAAVDEGREGAAVIKTFLDTPIPMGYVHLLGLMVKLHNVLLALLMALVSVKHAGRYDSISTGRAFFRAFFMPLLYNALLIINDELTDPFGSDISDFPAHIITQQMDADVQSFVDIGDNLPNWIENLDLKKDQKKPA